MAYRRARRLLRFNLKRVKPFNFLCLTVLLWVIFDGILSFLTPIIITSRGVSGTQLGLIIGFSSVAGIVFDLLLCRLLRKANYRLIFLVMFIVSFFYPLFLWQAKTMPFFLLTMGIWGLYFDLYNIAGFDFVGEEVEEGNRSFVLGALQVFQSAGYLVAPLLAGFFITRNLHFGSFSLVWYFIAASAFFFLLLILVKHPKKPPKEVEDERSRPSFRKIISLWRKISRFILPVLLSTLFLSLVDSFFWTIGPLFAVNPGSGGQSGWLLAAYQAPTLLTGWFVSPVNGWLGKKRTALLALLVAGVFLTGMALAPNFEISILLVFCASFFISLSWPSLASAYADYLAETPQAQAEIETLQDSFSNLGFIVGPIVAGLLIGIVGNQMAFSVLGIIMIVAMIILLKITPQNITIKLKKTDL